MDLTSGAFLAVLMIATLASSAAIVVFWGRLAPDRPRAIAGRIGALLGVNLLLLLTVSAGLNDAFGFFADWTDLAGAFQSSTPVSATTRGTSAAAAADAPVPSSDSLPSPASAPPLSPPVVQDGQRQYDFRVTGPVSHLTGKVVVYVPDGYSDPAQAARRYPVIQTFHGYPGTPEQWLDAMDLGQVVDTEVDAGRMSPVVIVSPTLELPKGRDTECVDGPGLAMETWLTVDVPDWVVRNFRVRLTRNAWATAGLSAGGWCAAMAAVLHPARYGASIVFGGYFSPQFGHNYQPFGPHVPPRYDLVNVIRTAPPPVAMWIETSHSDKLSYASTAAFLRVVRAPMSVRSVQYAHAAHSIPLWAGLVPDAVQWLASQVPGFHGPA